MQPEVIKEEYIKIELWSKPLSRHRYSFKDMKRVERPRSNDAGDIVVEQMKKRINSTGFSDTDAEPASSALRSSQNTEYRVSQETNIPPSSHEAPAAENEDAFDLGSRVLSEFPEEFASVLTKPDADAVSNESGPGNGSIHAENSLSSYDDYEHASDYGYPSDEEYDNEKPAKKKKNKPKKTSIKIRIDRFLYDYSELEREALEDAVSDMINSDGYYDEVVPLDVEMGDDEHDSESVKINPRLIAAVTLLIIVTGALIYAIADLF